MSPIASPKRPFYGQAADPSFDPSSPSTKYVQ
jgi:hypothetical protein